MKKKLIKRKERINLYEVFKRKINKKKYMNDKTPASIILFRARTNTLLLNDKIRLIKGETKCLWCGYKFKDIYNFIIYWHR